MALVQVEDKMNQVAETAPSVIGNVVESEINTDEETTSTEISKDTDNSKYEEKRQDYEAQGTAKIVGTSGTTTSSAAAKSSDAQSVAEYSEGNRKEEEPQITEPSDSPPPTPPANETIEKPKSKESSPVQTLKATSPQPSQVKPFEPIKPFEPLQPLEPPKSLEIVKEITNTTKSEDNEIEDVDTKKEENKESAETDSNVQENSKEEMEIKSEVVESEAIVSTVEEVSAETKTETVSETKVEEESVNDSLTSVGENEEPKNVNQIPQTTIEQQTDAIPTVKEDQSTKSTTETPKITEIAQVPETEATESAEKIIPIQVEAQKPTEIEEPQPHPPSSETSVAPQTISCPVPAQSQPQPSVPLPSAPVESQHQPIAALPPAPVELQAQPTVTLPPTPVQLQCQPTAPLPTPITQRPPQTNATWPPPSAQIQHQPTPPFTSAPQQYYTSPTGPTQIQSQPYISSPIPPQCPTFKNVPMNLLAEPPQPKVPLQPFQSEPTFYQAEPKIYQPILRKSPTFVPVQEYLSSHKSEIKEEKIKNTLKEIISEIDTYAEKDRELKSYDGTRRINESEKQYNYEQYHSSYDTQYGQNPKNSWVARLPSCLPATPRPYTLPPEFRTYPYNTNTQHSQEVSESYSSYTSDYSLIRDENISKPINLEKIFTPAQDAPQITPQKNKKMFASSDFYAKGLHPTMEEQVELARRISSSLSDANNQTSKGQSMYVNRKKRSVKWVHEGEGQANGTENGFGVEGHDENKPLLQLVMNPRGKLQDIYSLRKQGYSIDAALSPEFCQEIVRDLNSPRGKGAELFAKRRKKSEKWVVGETEGTRSIYEPPPTPKPVLVPVLPPNNLPTPSYLPETAQRVQHHQKLDQIQEQYVRPRVKLIKSPWDAALETGSVEAAFENLPPVWPKRGNFVKPTVASYEHAMKSNTLEEWDGTAKYASNPAYNSNSINRMVDNFQKGVSNVDVYKPKLPRAWNSQAPPVQQYKPASPLPHSPVGRPTLVRTPSYKPEVPPTVFVPKETQYTSPSYEIYNINQSTPPPTTRKYGNFNNYNTAPRGWGQSAVYKPISFTDYSDF